jgi:hypothetical protein
MLFPMKDVGILLMIAGSLLLLAGALILGLHAVGGKLPLDFVWEGKNWKVVFPLGSSLLISFVLTLLLNVFFWLFLWR